MEKFVRVFKRIECLRAVWEDLCAGSADATPYQSYVWNKNVDDCYKSNTYIFLNYKVRYFVYYKNNQPLIIAPMALVKTKNGDCYSQLLGQYTKSGELNFIYSDKADDEDFYFLVEYILSYCPHEIRFYEIGNYTKFNKFLQGYERAEKISDRICVKCVVPSTKEENYGVLSKSVRQTIRTTYNRLNKEEIPWKVEVFKGYNFNESELTEISNIYCKREAEWNGQKAKTNGERSRNPIGTLLKLFFKNKDAIINFSNNENFIYVRCMIDGKVAGYFWGIVNSKGYCIVPTLAIDSDYSKYSPGLLMIHHFLNKEIENGNLSVFDLSRGDETYKSRYLPNPIKYVNNDYRIKQ